MQIVHSIQELPAGRRKVSLAVGMFDGVHLGHQQVIRQAVTDAEQHEGQAIVITFDRHPNSIVAPERVPPLIYSPAQKARAIAALGVEAMLVIPFTREFSAQSAEEFVGQLVRALAVQSICVGSSFVFGHRRSGNVGVLQRLGAEHGFSVHGAAAVGLDGEVVSSTRIRDALREGAFNRASQMLGREYALAGMVIRGDELGRKLGFPTANLEVSGVLVPPHGVYAAHAAVDRTRHRAAVNIGLRPTLGAPAPQRRVEAHLLDFHGDLYGRELELTFVGKLRDEQKFASLAELQAQIVRDVEAARARF